MILFAGIKVTPVQAAKLVVIERGEQTNVFWGDYIECSTEREEELVGEALERQQIRVREFLNIEDLYWKVFAKKTRDSGLPEDPDEEY